MKIIEFIIDKDVTIWYHSIEEKFKSLKEELILKKIKFLSGIVLTVIMVSLFVIPVFADPEVLSNFNFNDLESGSEIPPGTSHSDFGVQGYPKQNAISVADFPSATDKTLNLTKTIGEDCYIQTVMTPVSEILITDVKIYFEKLNTICNIMYREPTPQFFNVLSFHPDGTITTMDDDPNNEDDVVGEFKIGEWIKVVTVVDIANGKYSAYLNEKLMFENRVIPFSEYDTVGHVRFAINSGEAADSTTVYINDWRVYLNDAVMDDVYFGGTPFEVPPDEFEDALEIEEATAPADTAPVVAAVPETPVAPATNDTSFGGIFILLLCSIAAGLIVSKRRA